MAALTAFFSGLSLNTFLLAAASLFADISTEMLYPVLPIFLTQTLGASAGIVGLVEGIAQATQNVIQGLSGWLADRSRRRKPLALLGYSIAALAKPLMALAPSWAAVLAARSLDRLGSGMRSAPRDALIAESASDAHRGKAFGLEGFGDNLGAFIGPLLAILLLSQLHLGIRSIFLLAVIPGALAGIALVFVRERPGPRHPAATIELGFHRFPKSYKKYLLATALFGIGSSSNAFLILRARDLGVSLTTTIFIYALFNLVAALASYPAGHLSDTLGRKRMLLGALLVFFAVYVAFALTTQVVLVGVLFVLYGVYQGVFRSVGKALVTDLVPAELRASGVGWYTATIGFAGLIASVVAGQLWTRIGPPATFLLGAGAALVGAIALALLVPGHRDG